MLDGTYVGVANGLTESFNLKLLQRGDCFVDGTCVGVSDGLIEGAFDARGPEDAALASKGRLFYIKLLEHKDCLLDG